MCLFFRSIPRKSIQIMVPLVAIALVTGCETDSSESVSRNLSVDVTGYYSGNLSGGRIIEQSSGAAITSLDLRQGGDRLEAYDNNGEIFKGTIGQVDGERASFTLEGKTTAGVAGTISGYIDISGSSATMSGTWFEPSMSSRVAASATVAEPSNLSIAPTSATLNTNNATQTFTASGGGGGYSWSLSNDGIGSILGSGSSVEYTRTGSGNNTITVSSGDDSSKASISQP